MITRRPIVVVLLMADLCGKDGAAAWARNLLSQLRQLEGIRFVVVTCVDTLVSRENEREVIERKFEHLSISRQDSASGAARATEIGGLLHPIQSLCGYVGEQSIWARPYVEKEFSAIVGSIRPDLVMINDVWAALHLSIGFYVKHRTCLIMLNDEVSFHRELLSYLAPGLKMYGRIKWIAQRRFRNKVEGIVRKCHAMIVLTRNDIPRVVPDNQLTAVLPPLLSEKSEAWVYKKSRKLLFVGHIKHFSNRYAIEWICTKLMPAMRSLDETIGIFIVGATEGGVPIHWRGGNVTFLGDVGRDGIIGHLISDDLFIAPIKNPFGAKLKLAECAAYGMPFVATDAAMSGLAFLPQIPRIDLDAPVTAARIVKQCIEQGGRLNELSAYISREVRRARGVQSQEWEKFIWKAVGGEAPQRSM